MWSCNYIVHIILTRIISAYFMIASTQTPNTSPIITRITLLCIRASICCWFQQRYFDPLASETFDANNVPYFSDTLTTTISLCPRLKYSPCTTTAEAVTSPAILWVPLPSTKPRVNASLPLHTSYYRLLYFAKHSGAEHNPVG